MKDVRLTKTTGMYDLLLEGGLFKWCYDGTQVANHGLIRIRVFRGEMNLHTDIGTRFYDVVFNVQSSKAEVKLELTSQLLSVTGVQYIEEFELEKNETTKAWDCSGIIQTEFGTESFETVIAL